MYQNPAVKKREAPPPSYFDSHTSSPTSKVKAEEYYGYDEDDVDQVEQEVQQLQRHSKSLAELLAEQNRILDILNEQINPSTASYAAQGTAPTYSVAPPPAKPFEKKEIPKEIERQKPYSDPRLDSSDLIERYKGLKSKIAYLDAALTFPDWMIIPDFISETRTELSRTKFIEQKLEQRFNTIIHLKSRLKVLDAANENKLINNISLLDSAKVAFGSNRQTIIHNTYYSESFAKDLLTSETDPSLGLESNILMYTILKEEIESMKSKSTLSIFPAKDTKGETVAMKQQNMAELEKKFYTTIVLGENLEKLNEEFHFKKDKLSSLEPFISCVIS